MRIFIILGLLVSSLLISAQHTFSIIAVDATTGEIGSAGATCLDENAIEHGALVISDVIPNVGAIHSQASLIFQNQTNAHNRMVMGDSPEEIMDWLVANDVQNNPEVRQYGVVDLNGGNPRSAAFTGEDCFDEHNHITGSNYSIQGNILITQEVLTNMEAGFLNTEGSLADKLMGAMQGANIPGADSRCLDEGVSSLSAFLRVAQPTDTDASYGNLSLDINISATPNGVEPIDELQNAYDDFLSKDVEVLIFPSPIIDFWVSPNPSNGAITVFDRLMVADEIVVFNMLHQSILSKKTNAANTHTALDLAFVESGVYLMEMRKNGLVVNIEKIVIRR